MSSEIFVLATNVGDPGLIAGNLSFPFKSIFVLDVSLVTAKFFNLLI